MMSTTSIPLSSSFFSDEATSVVVGLDTTGAGGGSFSPSTLYSNYKSVSPGFVPGSGTTRTLSLP